MTERKRIGSIALIVILLACTIAIVAFVMGNGTAPVGPPTPVPGSGGVSSIIGADDLTPVSTFTTLNAGVGLQGVGSGSTFTLNVITPTPGVSSTLRNGLAIPAGSTSANTAYIGIPGAVIYSGAAQFVVAGDLYYEIWQTIEEITVNQISFEVTSAGNPGDQCRVGIYEVDENWQATILELDAGLVTVDSTGWKSAAVNTVLPADTYASALICESGPALYSHNTASYIQGAINSSTTSSTRNVHTRLDSAPTGDPFTNGFANPGDSPWDTQGLVNIGSEGKFLLMRWSVN